MGGDGGTIGSTRAYLRGVGKACHTADHPSHRHRQKSSSVSDDTAATIVEHAQRILNTCAVSGDNLDFSPQTNMKGEHTLGIAVVTNSDSIVACPYGRLYKREKIVEALLQRAQTRSGSGGNGMEENPTSISHIRGLKDLVPVRFHVVKNYNSTSSSSSSDYIIERKEQKLSPHNDSHSKYYTPTCPITGLDIGSGKVSSYVIVRRSNTLVLPAKTKKGGSDANKLEEDEVLASLGPNVLSERAIKEMGIQELQAEFGPFDANDMILLAPPLGGGVFDKIQRRWEEKVEFDRQAKAEKKKKDKKRKRYITEGEDTIVSTKKTSSTTSTKNDNDNDKPNRMSSIHHGGNTRDDDTSHKKKSSSLSSSVVSLATGKDARSTVQSAISHSPILQNLFGANRTNEQSKKPKSEKEMRDALFTRNC